MNIWRDCGDHPCMTGTDLVWVIVIVVVAVVMYTIGEHWRNRP